MEVRLKSIFPGMQTLELGWRLFVYNRTKSGLSTYEAKLEFPSQLR